MERAAQAGHACKRPVLRFVTAHFAHFASPSHCLLQGADVNGVSHLPRITRKGTVVSSNL